MANAAAHLETFLRAVHRRLVLVRALERAGFGALAGCAAGALLIPPLLWRAQPALAPVGALLALGTAAGLLWGVVRRPSALVAAMEADRQLGLQDLLSTAASVGPGRENPWELTVVALADQQCIRHSPA